MIDERGWDVQLYFADEDDVEYGPATISLDAGGNYVGTVMVFPGHTVHLTTGVLWVDGIRWRGPALPARETCPGHRETKMVLTVPRWIVDELESVIEQVANR